MVPGFGAPFWVRNSGASSVPVILRLIVVSTGASVAILYWIGCVASAASARSRAAIMSRWMNASDAVVKSHATTMSLVAMPAAVSASSTSPKCGRIFSSNLWPVFLPSRSAAKPGGTTSALPSFALTRVVIATA